MSPKRDWLWQEYFSQDFANVERHEVKHPQRKHRHDRPEPPPILCERCQKNTREGYVIHDGHCWCLSCSTVVLDR